MVSEEASAMSVDAPATTTEKLQNVRLEILETISKAQREHGLRHRDFARYRGYCARRLARLYGACQLKHGKGRYVHKKLSAETISDERTLLIPLVQSERAWAYAMEMKDLGSVKKKQSHLRSHMLRRFKKAALHANELAVLCATLGDEQTALEGDAYNNYMGGICALEQGKDYIGAMSKLLRAKRVYAKLSLLGDQKRLEMYRARVEEIVDLVSFALYRQGKTANIAAIEEEAVKDLASNSVFTMEVDAPPESDDKIRWHAMDFELKNRDARVLIAQAQEHLKKLATLKNPTGYKANTLFSKAIALYDEARSKLNDDVEKENAKALYEEEAEERAERIKLTEIALTLQIKDKIIDRNKFINDMLDKKLNGKAKKERADKGLNFADLARMYDAATVDFEDLMEIAPILLRLKPEDANKHIEEFEVDCEAEVMLLKARHNVAMGCYNVQKGDIQEARAFFDIATDLARDAEGRDCAGEIQDEAADLIKDIQTRVERAEKSVKEADATEPAKRSQSGSDLTSQVTEKLTKLFSWKAK